MRHLLCPQHGWHSATSASETPFSIPSAIAANLLGGVSEALFVDPSDVAPCPSQLADAESVALPLAVLMAWRVLVAQPGAAHEGTQVLVTGIGDGEALRSLEEAKK